MQGVPAGTWRIQVTAESAESWRADAVVRAGETTAIVLR
jgi:hypothetical protein